MARLSRMTRKRLGELFLAEGLITQEQLETALAAQAAGGGIVGEILVTQGAVAEEDVARLIARQWGLPYLDPSRYEIAPEMREVFPEAALLQYRFVPLDLFAESILIVVADVMEEEKIAEIEKLAGKHAFVAVGTASAVRRVQAEHFHAGSEQLNELGSLLLGEGEESVEAPDAD